LTNRSPRSPKAKRHRAALAEADDARTVVTDLISGRPCRKMRNKLIEKLCVRLEAAFRCRWAFRRL